VPYILDDEPDELIGSINGVPIRGPLSQLSDRQEISGFLAIEDNQKRQCVSERFKNVKWVTLIHPASFVDPSARLGAGTYIAAGAVVNAEAVLGNQVMVNTGASVGHDCIVEDFVQIESGVRLGGGAHVGKGVLLEIGSAVVPNCSIGARAILGPRAVAINHLLAGETYAGVPARPVQELETSPPRTAASLQPNSRRISLDRGLVTVLISSAGRRVELIRCFQADAKALGLKLRVLAVDVDPEMSSACQAADKSLQVSPCTSPRFATDLLHICEKEKVTLVVPTIDPELPILAEQQPQFKALGTRILVSSPAIVSMARDKTATAEFLKRNGIPSPRTAPLAELLSQRERWPWPLILKPVSGSGSVGICVVQNLHEANQAAARRNDYIAQEIVYGSEYTVNLFFDQFGNLRSAVPHQRCDVRAGEVSKGVTRRESRIVDVAWRLGSVLKGAVGSLCFQTITPESGEPVVFEINARFGGGYPLAHQAGATFTKWLLEEVAALPTSANDRWQEGLTMLRYDAALFRRATPES
jgi:carbamoyl-phosphate synthase large subunit